MKEVVKSKRIIGAVVNDRGKLVLILEDGSQWMQAYIRDDDWGGAIVDIYWEELKADNRTL